MASLGLGREEASGGSSECTAVEDIIHGMDELSMASHLLLGLLKPSEFSSAPALSEAEASQFYAGPMFRKAPEPSALPLPSFLAE